MLKTFREAISREKCSFFNIVQNMLKTITSRALLVAVAIASVAELKRKETANLKPDVDVIIAK